MPSRSQSSQAAGAGVARQARLPAWLQIALKLFPGRPSGSHQTAQWLLGEIPSELALKAEFDIGDEVAFDNSDGVQCGTIVRLNPKTASVRVSASSFYRVRYCHLDRQSSESREHRPALLRTVAGQARRLMRRHGLGADWKFQFDDATSRAGYCNYSRKRISLAWQYCLNASAAERRDTILHEIAHALVGYSHHHDRVWKAKALEIGCNGKRCHQVTFTPPRYIAFCPQCKWFSKRNVRQRGRACLKCQTPTNYERYSDEGWREKVRSSAWRQS